jgi:hypothetical protein
MVFNETQEDVDIAMAAAVKFLKTYFNGNGDVVHLNKSMVDMVVTAGGKSIYIEHKYRDHISGHYPTIWLSNKKYKFLTKLSETNKVLFMVTWIDATGYVVLNKAVPVSFNTRRRLRGNRPGDVDEVVAEFSMKDFIFF